MNRRQVAVLAFGLGVLVNPLLVDRLTAGWYWNHFVSRINLEQGSPHA